MIRHYLSGLLLLTCVTNAMAEDSKSLSVDTSVSFLSDYMFRGTNLYDGTSIQPSLNVEYDTGSGVIGGNLWMHLSAEGGDSVTENYTELDETLSYAYDFDGLSVKVGHFWYTYPDSDDDINDTAEFFATVTIDDSSFNTILPVSPTISAYHDYDEYDAQYYELALSHTFTPTSMGEGFNLTPYVAFGFSQNGEKLYADDGFVQATFGTSFETQLGDITVTPSINYTAESDDAAVNEFWVATNFGYSF